MPHLLYTGILGLLLLTSTGFGQTTDQLYATYQSSQQAEKVHTAEKLSDIYVSENRDSLRSLGEDLFFYGIDEHYYPAIEKGKLILAEYYVQTGKPVQGISTAKALLGAMKERNDVKQIAIAAKIISQGYRVQKDANSAFYWAEKAVKNSNQSNDPEVKTFGLISLAEAYLMKKKTAQSIATFEQYISLSKPLKNTRGLSSAYARLGDIYRLQGNLKKAEYYFQLQLSTAKAAKLSTPLGHAYNNIAILYFEKGDTISARKEFIKALNLRLKSKDLRAISESYYNLGDYHFYINQSEKALFWYRKSMEFAENNHLWAEQKDAYRAMVEVAKASGDYEMAVGYLENVLQIEAKIQRDNMEDDEELALQQKQFLEMELKATQEGFASNEHWYNYLRWEWFVIALLLLSLIGISRKRSEH